MNISEALRKIKKIKGDLALEQNKMKLSCSWKVNDEPAWKFEEARDNLVTLTEELLELEAKVAQANAVTKVSFRNKEMTLAYVIRFLQETKSQIALYESLVVKTKPEIERDSVYDEEKEKYVTVKNEVKWASALTEISKEQKVKELKKLFDELNTVLENSNHKTSV